MGHDNYVSRAIYQNGIPSPKLRGCSKTVMEVFHPLLSSVDVLCSNTLGDLDIMVLLPEIGVVPLRQTFFLEIKVCNQEGRLDPFHMT